MEQQTVSPDWPEVVKRFKFSTPKANKPSLIKTATIVGGFLVVLICVLTAASLSHNLPILGHQNAFKHRERTGVPSSHTGLVAPEIFYNLFAALRHPVTSDSYVDIHGEIFKTSAEGPWWTGPLGKKVLIVDIDTRLANGTNELWSGDGYRLDWDDLEPRGNGILSASQINHYLYAQVHGYDYRFFRANALEGLHNTWVKPHALLEMLGLGYEFVVFLDGDAIINNLEVPLEWLLNRWGVTNQTSIAVSLDVANTELPKDSRGNVQVNTGFIVAQQLPETLNILKAWKDCTSETRYPGCGRWKQKWSHEQAAFSDYIRHDPEFTVHPSRIVQISCDDAMGYPTLKNTRWITEDCRGNFIRHYTIDKAETIHATGLGILQSVVELVRKDLVSKQRTYRIDEKRR